MLKADFHIHTHYSKCSDMKPMELVKASVSKGYDIIGVVDHNRIDGGLAVKKIAGKKLLVIPGEEIKTNYGEVIVLLSDGKYNKDLIEVCERTRDMNHFVVVPHPFDYLRIKTCLRSNVEKVKKLVDAIEVFNSRVMLNQFNKIAERYATKNNISKIAGSDAHFLEEIGNAACFLDCDRSIDSILESIRKNRLKFQCKKCSILSHVKSNITLPIERLVSD